VVKQQKIVLFYLEKRLKISYGQDFVYVENHIMSSESRVSDGMSCVALRSWCIVMNARASSEGKENIKDDSKGTSCA